MLPRDRKIVEQKPCVYLSYNKDKARWEETAPAIDCGFRCEGCGFDPKEQKRRMETGGWVFDENGIQHLLFKSVKPPETLA